MLVKFNKTIQNSKQRYLIADLFNNFGNVYLQKNQFNKSLEYFMKSLNLHLITVGQFHLRTARIFNNIGVIYYNQSELDHAREQYERALKIYRQIIDENNNEIANCINNIGLVYYAQKQCDQALKNYLKAQQIYLKSVGQYHVDTANIMINIGRVYLTQQQHEKALQKYMKALQIYEKLDYNLYQKSKVLNTIASIYQQIDILKAIEFSQKVLQIYDKIFESKNHPQMLEILKKLGTLHMVNREFSLMLEYFQKALMMLDHKMDYKHTEEIMNRIVNVYNMISDSNALENYYNQTCIVLKGIFSEEDEIVIENANKFSERYEFLLSNIEQF